MSEALLRWQVDPDTIRCPKNLRRIRVAGAPRALDIVELQLNRPIHRPPRGVLHPPDQSRAGGHHGGPSEQKHHQRPADHDDQQQPTAAAGERDRGSDQKKPPPPPPPPPHQGQGSQNSQQPPGAAGDDDDDDYVSGHGQPLAEIFAVRTGFLFFGSIAVFDGMRGQVIYENVDNDAAPPVDHGGPSSSRSDEDDQPLLLTGPYRAISAYGSFMIDFDIAGPVKDAAELLWDCYEEEDYDMPVTKTITTRRGQKVKVTYAVLSDAVEVNLEVHLRLSEPTADGVVCGEIATRSKAFDGNEQAWSVLFCSEECVPPITDGSSSLPRLPLARSVVAMPLGCPMQIKVTLFDAPKTRRAIPFLQRQDIELTLDHCTTTITAENGREVEVNITLPDLYPREEP